MESSPATVKITVVKNGNTVLISLLIMSAIVILCGIFAIVYSTQSLVTNDLDEMRIRLLQSNVSMLSLEELINLHNVTLLDQNITQAELNMTVLNTRLIIVESNILTLEVTSTVINATITSYFENITTLYTNIDIQWSFLANLTAFLQSNYDIFTFVNQTAFEISVYGIRTVNYVPPAESNIQLVGTCGMNVSIGLLPGTVLVDACELQFQIANLTNILQTTAVQLFASVNMSNTTLNTINWQNPNAGQIFIVAGNAASIVPGNESNAISISNLDLQRINGVYQVNTILNDSYTIIVNNATDNSIHIGLVYFLQNINATLGIVNLTANQENYTLSTTLSAYGTTDAPPSTVCSYAISTADTAVIPAGVYSWFPSNTSSYMNLLTCSPSANASEHGVVVKDCIYNTASPIKTGRGACFALTDLYAVYKIDFYVTVLAWWSLDGSGYENGNRVELQYCLEGTSNCGITSSNWTRLTQPCINSINARTSITITGSTMVFTADQIYPRIMARLFCRIGPTDDGNNFMTVPCFFNSGGPMVLDMIMTITRIA